MNCRRFEKQEQQEHQGEVQQCDWCERNALESQLWYWMARKYAGTTVQVQDTQGRGQEQQMFSSASNHQKEEKLIERLIVNGEEISSSAEIKGALCNTSGTYTENKRHRL